MVAVELTTTVKMGETRSREKKDNRKDIVPRNDLLFYSALIPFSHTHGQTDEWIRELEDCFFPPFGF